MTSSLDTIPATEGLEAMKEWIMSTLDQFMSRNPPDKVEDRVRDAFMFMDLPALKESELVERTKIVDLTRLLSEMEVRRGDTVRGMTALGVHVDGAQNFGYKGEEIIKKSSDHRKGIWNNAGSEVVIIPPT
jgi:hypothetical protein